MDKIIPAKNYYDPGIYELEQKQIFEKEWLFAGMKGELPEKKNWFTLNIAGRSVIIYNTGTEVKAFRNVCPHRFNRILTEERGSGPLLCQYHLWAFDNEGQLIGKKDVCPQPEEKICLKSYAVRLAGDFIFINFADTPERSLEEQLTPELYDLLVYQSGHVRNITDHITLPHTCNWKFIIENVMEQHHCIIVHKDTLGKTGYCGIGKPMEQFLWGKNSSFTFMSTDKEMEKKRQSFMKRVFDSKNITDKYQHILLYPNSVVSIFEGVCFTIGRVIPKSADETVFLLTVATDANKENAYKKLIEEFNTVNADFIKTVFTEDKAVLDTLQTGVKEMENDGYQYNSETRVGWFTESYLESMKQ